MVPASFLMLAATLSSRLVRSVHVMMAATRHFLLHSLLILIFCSCALMQAPHELQHAHRHLCSCVTRLTNSLKLARQQFCSCVTCLTQKSSARLRGFGVQRGFLAAACIACILRFVGLYIGLTPASLEGSPAVVPCLGDARARDFLLTKACLLLLFCGCSLHASRSQVN